VAPTEGGPRRQVAVLVRHLSGREEIIPLRAWRAERAEDRACSNSAN
jgi:hypothetical protein